MTHHEIPGVTFVEKDMNIYRPGIFSGTISSADSLFNRGILWDNRNRISFCKLSLQLFYNSLIVLLKNTLYSAFFEGYVKENEDIHSSLLGERKEMFQIFVYNTQRSFIITNLDNNHS
jgi:hypothetical protein